jgi:hypothetical protein
LLTLVAALVGSLTKANSLHEARPGTSCNQSGARR